MENLSVFSTSSYRSFINLWLKKERPKRGLLSQLCHAMGCQNAHVTRVLAEKIHLTPDQGYRLSRFFGFSKAESDYFMKLLEYERAGDSIYKQHLKQEIDRLKKENENLSNKFKEARIDTAEKEMLYYSSWHWIALHYITEIPKYQTLRSISERLGVSESFALQALSQLEGFGLVQREGDRWVLNSGSIHLPKTSPLNSVQHGNWRQRAVLKSQDSESDGLHFTAVQTLSHEDFEKIKGLLLELLERYRKIARPSSPEELISFSLDFFRV